MGGTFEQSEIFRNSDYFQTATATTTAKVSWESSRREFIPRYIDYGGLR